MSNKKSLKHYLVEKEKPFLLDENHNGKTIMISGAWGSGKTHFWQKEIEPILIKSLKEKDKACVYVSLYGKESLSDIKSDVYLSASGKSSLSKEVATFGMEALSAIKDSELLIGKVVKAGKGLADSKKIQKGIGRLKQGGIICFDDFERKSKEVNLNDLFGFISQLAINLECKVVIILNRDVFKGKEAETFSRVKEKTISKFFYFKPSIEELFESISNDDKYHPLDDYKQDILNVIKETDELNARIYTQVLDNCLEWLIVKASIGKSIIRVLVLGTFNFVLNHLILSSPKGYDSGYKEDENIVYSNFNFPDKRLYRIFPSRKKKTTAVIKNEILGRKEEVFMRRYQNDTTLSLSDKIRIRLAETRDNKNIFSESEQTYIFDWLKTNSHLLAELWKYGYLLYYLDDVDEAKYNEIVQFIESGILI